MTLRPSALLLTAFCAAAPAAAETRLAPDAWAEDYAGRYAVNGKCDDPEAIWVLHPATVQAGRLNCNGIGKINWDGDTVLAVPLTDCAWDGSERPNRIMHFEQVRAGTVTALDTADGAQVSLSPCGD